MAWNDSSEFIVGQSGSLNFAAVGSTLPTTPTAAINAAFVGGGYQTEDGLGVNISKQIQEFQSWQARGVTRRVMTGSDLTITGQLQQWNESNLPFALGGGTVSSVSGGYKYTPPTDSDSLAESALVADVIDGTRVLRFVIPRGTVTETVDTTFNDTSLSVLPVSFKTLEPADGSPGWYLFTNDEAAFAAGS